MRAQSPSVRDVFADSGTGLFSNILERICVPGTILIALLSGFGAVNTAWEAVAWQSMSKRCASFAVAPLVPT